jgi:hypothetical protein
MFEFEIRFIKILFKRIVKFIPLNQCRFDYLNSTDSNAIDYNGEEINQWKAN